MRHDLQLALPMLPDIQLAKQAPSICSVARCLIKSSARVPVSRSLGGRKQTNAVLS